MQHKFYLLQLQHITIFIHEVHSLARQLLNHWQTLFENNNQINKSTNQLILKGGGENRQEVCR